MNGERQAPGHPSAFRRRTRIWQQTEVLDREECGALIARSEAVGYEEAPIMGFRGPEMRPEMRNNRRAIIDDRPLAAALWPRMAELVPSEIGPYRVVGLNERFRFYRYGEGQYFRWHRDGAFHRTAVEQSLLTVLLFLNSAGEDFTGGSTEFEAYEPVAPREGSVLVFEHVLGHQGAPVLSGHKYVARSDVMYRRGP